MHNIVTVLLNPGEDFAWVHEGTRWNPPEIIIELQFEEKPTSEDAMRRLEDCWLGHYRALVKINADVLTPEYCVVRTYRPFENVKSRDEKATLATKISIALLPVKAKLERKVCRTENPWMPHHVLGS